MTYKNARRSATIALSALAAAPLIAAAGPAYASTQAVPNSATGCSSNVCMYLSTPSGGKVYVQAWARNSNFTGYFHLSGPGVSSNSSTALWYGGKGNYYQWNGISAVVGQYCVGGYASNGTYEGTACENVE